MARKVVFNQEARGYFKQGVDSLADTVKVTLGPRGHNVVLDRKFGTPLSTHDGVTVAKEIELADHFINMGAAMIKEAATKTNSDVGDGTTTCTVLAQAMIAEGFKNLAAGADAQSLRKGMQFAVAATIDELERKARPVTAKEQVTRIAAVTAHDAEIGKIVGDLLEKVGKDGVVTVDEGKGTGYETDFVQGMKFDRGFVSPYFVTDSARMEAVVENIYILITDKKISSVNDILPFLEKVTPLTRNILIIADDIEGEALSLLVVNKMKGNLNCLAVKAPGFGDRRKAMLEDLAVLTGGTVISEEQGRTLDSVNIKDLGRAGRVVADKDNSTIIEGRGKAAEIQSRINQLKIQVQDTKSDYDREKLQERLAKLSGGVGVIKVGAPTETEMKDRKRRVEGALSATRAAAEEGTLPGGGVALFNAAKAIQISGLQSDEAIGARLILRALEEPLRQLARNAGWDGALVVGSLSKAPAGTGFDVIKEEFVNMEDKGIVDPLKVTRSALQNAASVAELALITEALIADAPENYTEQGEGPG